jgi:hypothetical protein
MKATRPVSNAWPNFPIPIKSQPSLNCWTRIVKDSKLPLTQRLATANLTRGALSIRFEGRTTSGHAPPVFLNR